MYTINIHICDLPHHTRAMIELTNDPFTFEIYVNKWLSPSEQRQAVLHELRHVVDDDFFSIIGANMLEHMLHGTELDERIADNFNFYYHYMD